MFAGMLNLVPLARHDGGFKMRGFDAVDVPVCGPTTVRFLRLEVFSRHLMLLCCHGRLLVNIKLFG